MRKNIFVVCFVVLTIVLAGCSGGDDSVSRYTLTINIDGQGTVQHAKGTVQTTGSAEFEKGTTVTLNLEPAPGWFFNGWTSSDGNEVVKDEDRWKIVINNNKNITAEFTRIQHDLVVDTIGQGTISQQIVSTPQGISYDQGTVVELTAEAEAGWRFDHWEGDLTGSENPKNVTVDKEKDVTAVFATFADEAEVDLSGENGELTIAEYGSKEEILTVLYSRNDNGTNWNVGSLSTTLESTTSNIVTNEFYFMESRIQSLSNEIRPLDGSENRFLKEKERIAYSNHESAKLSQSLSLNYSDPAVGTTETFNVYDGEEGFNQVDGTLKVKGEHSLFWVDNTITVSESDLIRMRDEFENEIYSTVTTYFGRDPEASTFEVLNTAGNKVNVLITPLVGSYGGYFWSVDLYSKSKYSDSNERKIVFINHYNKDALDYQISTLAHEFQHMVFYNEDILNDKPYYSNSWINEGFAKLAEDLVGYGYANGIYSDLSYFLDNPSNTSLLAWAGGRNDYNASYLFARYIYDRFGAGIIDYVHSSDESYKDAIASYAGISFRQIFGDWALALYLDGVSNVDSKYKFSSIDFPQPEINPLSPGESWNNKEVNGWGINYTLIGSGNGSDLEIEVNNAATGGDFWLKALRGGSN